MKDEIKVIIRNSFYLYLIQGLNYLLPLFTLPFLIVTLSKDAFGKFSFAFAFSQFAILFVDFGFNLTTTKKIAENEQDIALVKNTFWNVLTIKTVFFIIASLVTIFLTLYVEKLQEYKEGIWISLITVFGTVLFPIWWFQGMNKMKLLSIINAVSKLLTFPFIFILVIGKNDQNIAILFQSLSMLVAGLISFVYLFKNYRFYFLNFSISLNYKVYLADIKDSWPIFLSNSSISLYTNSLTILLGLFSTTSNVGMFGAMERVVRVVCFGVLGPINQACFPFLAKLKTTDFTKAKKVFKVILLVITMLMVLAFVSFYFLEDFIIKHLFESYNSGSGTLLLLFMAMIFPIAIGGALGQLGLMALGEEVHKKKFANVYIYVGLISVPLSLASIYLYDIRGAVFSMMFVETTIFFLLFYFVKKYKFL